MLWRMAWRNLWRHKARTIIMTSAVALTYGLMLMSLGIGDDGHARMLREATKVAGGDVIVHGQGYWDTRASDVVIENANDVLDRVRDTPGVGAAMPRIIVNGLVSTSAGARPVLLQGVEPEAEAKLNDVAGDITMGTFLESERSDPIVLGARMVQKLDLELGDRVVLTASRPDGELIRALFHLTGVIETGMRELDEVLGYTTLEAAREAVGMEGMLTQIGVLASDGENGIDVAGAVEAALGPGSNDLEVLSWRDAVPEMVGFVELDDAFGYLYLAVIFLVVLFSITNTFLMAVMERVRELGLLSALGLRGERIGRLLLSETVLMTLLAMSVGFSLGFGAHLAVDHWGIPIAMYGIDNIEISGIDFADLVMHSTINPKKWIVATILVAVATVGSAVYPAWRASRLAPAEAMRFYE